MHWCSVDWEELVKVLSACLTPVIAVVTAYIAWQQHKTNQNQFRWALFERRMKVFNATGELIATVLRKSRTEDDDLKQFLMATREREFLFGSDIATYLDTVYNKAVELQPPVEAGNEQAQQQRTAKVMWFKGQMEEAKKQFGKYMSFED
jgi:hypothetical protein